MWALLPRRTLSGRLVWMRWVECRITYCIDETATYEYRLPLHRRGLVGWP